MIDTIGSKTLFPHQMAAVEWMLEREKDERFCGGFLCDEMGLGKTMSVLGLLLNSRVLRTLILGPLAVIQQWRTVCEEAGFAICVVEKGKWTRICGQPLQTHVYLANYDKLSFNYGIFKEINFQRVICDEAHVLRNSAGKKTRRLRRLVIPRKWLLTGTPIVNSYADIGTLMRLLDQEKKRYGSVTQRNAEMWMSRYALARTTEQLRDMLKDILPQPAQIVNHRIPFDTEEEAIFYRGVQGVLTENLQKLMAAEHMDMKMFLVLLMRLRQISVHPQVYIQARKKAVGKLYKRADWTGGSAKVNTILDILRGDAESHTTDREAATKESHGYIIFCNFREEIEILHERIAAEPSVYKVYDYHGSMSVAERTDCIEKLEKAAGAEKGHTILLAQIQCGGTGLNLQYLDRVIFTTPWWTAALMDQAAGRVLRLGQKRQVIIHNIALQEEETTSLNIDDFIQSKVEIKRKMCLDALNAANNQLSWDQEEEEPIVTAAMGAPVAPVAPVKKFKMMSTHIATEMAEMAVQLNKSWPCPVCLEDKNPTADMVLACGHKVCVSCRGKFCKIAECPTCRD